MSTLTTEQAIQVMNDTSRPLLEREQAMHQLKDDPSPAAVEQLMQALEDPEAGIRWAAASVLIEMGEPAMKPLLHALVDRHDSVWLREGAYRIFRDTRSGKVHEVTADLVKVFKGPAAEMSVTDAAGQALLKLAST